MAVTQTLLFHFQFDSNSYWVTEDTFSRTPLIQHPWDWTGARLSDSTYIDLSSYM